MSTTNPHESDLEASATCTCTSFWGPFRPIFGGHTLEEAATSVYFPTLAVSIWRLIFASFLSITLVYYLIIGTYSFQFFSVWSHFLLSLAFLFNTASSLTFLLSKYPSSFNLLASISIFLFQVAASSALFLDVVYWAILFDYEDAPTLSQLAQHAFNLIFVLLDMLFSLRMQFKVSYALVFVAYVLLYVVFVWIRFAIIDDFVYKFMDYRNRSAGIVVAYYLGVAAWGFVAAILIVVLSRLARLQCVKRKRGDNSFSDEEAVVE